MKRSDLVTYLDSYLRTAEIRDESLNGLQVEGPVDITTIAAAVDASLSAFEMAAERGAQLLIVHHGLFWGEPQTVTGAHYRRIKTLIERGLALYASHLPLDLHPEVGNNAEIARLLSIDDRQPFGEYHGVPIGCGGTLPAPVNPLALASTLAGGTGAPCTVLANCAVSSKVAIVSGGGTFALEEAARSGYDTLVTGETKHSSFHTAKEYGISVVFGGHYATETLGVRALAAHCAKKFGLASHFIDLPTGM